MTIKAVGAFPVKKIDVLEIELAMVEAAKFFKEPNGAILEEPRVRIIPTDGRNYIMAAPHLYDLIISEPSNPWIAGVASLFTKDFYAVAKEKLAPDGIFAQWMHNYSMSPDDFRMGLRTFAESFPYVTVWNMQESDFLLVGSLRQLNFDYPWFRKIFLENQTLRNDLKAQGLSDVYTVIGLYRMGKKELLAFTQGADFNTDDNALLEFSAPRSLGKSTTDLNRKLMEPFVSDPPWKYDSGWISPAQHHYYLAEALRASGWYERALREVDQALKIEPRNADCHLLRAQILTALDRNSEASLAAEKTLEYSPDKVRQVLALTEDFYTQQANEIYSKIVRLGSKEILPYVGLGTIALHRNNLAEAERWLREAERIRPAHAAVLLALGRLEGAKGNYTKAVTLLEESKEKGEDSATLYSELGEAYYQLEQWEKAVTTFREALRRQRRNTRWRLLYANALGQLGKAKEAEVKYREVLALDPDSSEAWKGLKSLGQKY
jgi:spermidine synthase